MAVGAKCRACSHIQAYLPLRGVKGALRRAARGQPALDLAPRLFARANGGSGFREHRRISFDERRGRMGILRGSLHFLRHYSPQDSSVLAGHGHAGPLPTHAGHELRQPTRCPVVAFARAQDRSLGAPDQLRAQGEVAALGDAPRTCLAHASPGSTSVRPDPLAGRTGVPTCVYA